MLCRPSIVALVAVSLGAFAGCSSEQPQARFTPDAVKAVGFPFAVTLDGYDTMGKLVLGCTGSVISPKLVLTAGQCAQAATWNVSAPYAGGQTATAKAATATDFQGISQGFQPDKSNTGFVLLDQPIMLDTYPSLADASTCMGCEVVHLGRVAHTTAAGEPTTIDHSGIAPGNAGGPIVRLSDGAIIGVSTGTIAPEAGIMTEEARRRGPTDRFNVAANGEVTYWAPDDIYESPLHVALATQEAVFIFPEHTLLSLPARDAPEAKAAMANLASVTGVGAGGAPAMLTKYVSEDMRSGSNAPSITTAQAVPPDNMMMPLSLLLALTQNLSPQTLPPYVPKTHVSPSIPPPPPASPPYSPPSMTSLGDILNDVGSVINLIGSVSSLLGLDFGGGCS